MRMNKNVVHHVDKAVFILLLVFAAAAILVAMITGPLGYDTVSKAASVSACIIGTALIAHTLHAFRPSRRER